MAAHVAAPSTVSDALNRAWRTLYAGFILDALVLIGAGLTDLLTSADITTQAFWVTLGVLVVKSVLTSAASFLLRLKVAPKPPAL